MMPPEIRSIISPTSVHLLGVRIDAVTVAQAIGAFQRMIETRRPSLVFNVNVDICMQIRRDPTLGAIFRSADLVLADGTPMMWAARLLKSPLPERVSGSDFVTTFCGVAANAGYRLFLLGAAPGVAWRAKIALEDMHPGLQIVDTYSPPYGFEHDEVENNRILERVTRAAPDVLFAAFGAPKEQQWLFRFRSDLGVPVSMGIGSSLDYLGGRLRRAPQWMQVWGLEWSYRLVQEPRRLSRRYLIDDSPFFYYVFREMLRQRNEPNAQDSK
jgi:N-acetylglucosaminyldiphosphoundecaprenol N-acetyl-beta-D-mannosaminyltransferase